MLTKLQGKKTYIIGLAMAVLNVLVAANAISPAHLVQINFVLTALGLTTLHAAIERN